jgi:hypothetical protein
MAQQDQLPTAVGTNHVTLNAIGRRNERTRCHVETRPGRGQ